MLAYITSCHNKFCCLEGKQPDQHAVHKTGHYSPTNIDSVHLVMACPDARAGVKIVKKKNPQSNLEQPKFRSHY